MAKKLSKEERATIRKRARRRGKDAEKSAAKFYDGFRVGGMGHEDLFFYKFSGEVKAREKLPTSIKKWLSQAKRNMSGAMKIPFVHCHEHNTSHKEDIVLCYATDFLEFIEWREGEKK